MPDQQQPALAPGQVWRSPSGKRTRTILHAWLSGTGNVHYRTATGREGIVPASEFEAMCKGWTLDAPAKEPTPCN